jgi:hypothetical protein
MALIIKVEEAAVHGRLPLIMWAVAEEQELY